MKLVERTLFPVDKSYVSRADIKLHIQSCLFFRSMVTHAKIFRCCFDVLIVILKEAPDWRVIRISQCILSCVIERVLRADPVRTSQVLLIL
jgi:hypothetical protein